MLATIYGLFDPIDRSLKYIGRTRGSLRKRLTGHCAAPTNKQMESWIDELARLGLMPIIEKISVCDWRFERDEEQRQIEYHVAAELLNDRCMSFA